MATWTDAARGDGVGAADDVTAAVVRAVSHKILLRDVEPVFGRLPPALWFHVHPFLVDKEN